MEATLVQKDEVDERGDVFDIEAARQGLETRFDFRSLGPHRYIDTTINVVRRNESLPSRRIRAPWLTGPAPCPVNNRDVPVIEIETLIAELLAPDRGDIFDLAFGDADDTGVREIERIDADGFPSSLKRIAFHSYDRPHLVIE